MSRTPGLAGSWAGGAPCGPGSSPHRERGGLHGERPSRGCLIPTVPARALQLQPGLAGVSVTPHRGTAAGRAVTPRTGGAIGGWRLPEQLIHPGGAPVPWNVCVWLRGSAWTSCQSCGRELQAHESPAHRVQREPWLPSRASVQMWQSRGCGLLECFCAFPSEGPAVHAGSGAVRAEEQQHCWVCSRCIYCKGTSLSLQSLCGKRMCTGKRAVDAPNNPDPCARATSQCSPQICAASKLCPVLAIPALPESSCPHLFSMVKVLSVVWRLC